MNEFKIIIKTCLVALTVPLLLSSCGKSSGSSALETIDTPASIATIMVSSSADLSNGTPLLGATIKGQVYIFFQDGADWYSRGVEKTVFYCCKSDADPHNIYPDDTGPPYMINVDLSPYSEGTTRELYADVFFSDSIKPIDSFAINFTISETVIGNSPPTINGSPSTTAIENKSYSFTPTAADTNTGDELIFSIDNKPTWALFNASDGTLSGTPTNNDLGTTSNIIISVSDGTDSSSLAEFSITASAPITGSATLAWTPPTENNDSSTLTDLAGYKIHYGFSSGSYTKVIDIDVGITERIIDNLTGPNTYHFVMTAYNEAGYTSAFSNEASKIIQ